MKKVLSLLLVVLTLPVSTAFATLPPLPGVLYGCAILSNVSAFPTTTFIYSRGANFEPTVLDDTMCMENNYNNGNFFAVDTKIFKKHTTHYNPFEDINAYPLQSQEGSTFDAGGGFDSTLDHAASIHRTYVIRGFDNATRTFIVAHVVDMIDGVTKNDTSSPSAPTHIDQSIDMHAPIFKDVPATSVYAQALATLKRSGAFKGYADGTFHPQARVNRAEFIAAVMRVDQTRRTSTTGQDGCTGVSPDAFTDFSPSVDHWYRDAVCIAYRWSIVQGYGDHTLRLADPINYAEAAKMTTSLWVGYGWQEAHPWYQPFTAVFENMKSVPSTITSPDQFITRGEMALLIYALTKPTPCGECVG